MALTAFGAEIWDGSAWVNLNDRLNYQVHGDFRESSQTERRRITAASVIVEGEYTVHSVRSNVTETVNIWVYGEDQVEVTANLVALEELFSQNSYQLRFHLDGSRETWDCFIADYGFTRNQAYSHNGRALFTAQVPRLPAIRYEINPDTELASVGTLTLTSSSGASGTVSFEGIGQIVVPQGTLYLSGEGSFSYTDAVIQAETGTLALAGAGTLTGSGVVL